MNWLPVSKRRRFALLFFILFALVAVLPLRAVFGIFRLDEMGVAARSIRGPIWWGAAEELQIGGVRLGTVDMFVSPLKLLVGQGQINIHRQLGAKDDIRGAISVGWAGRGIDDVTGSLPLAAALAPLPVGSVDLEGVSARFSRGQCIRAEGRVRARMMALISDLDLANGLTGEARCDGDAVALPLVSQSGMERLEVRITSGGRLQATMRVRSTDPLLVMALGANGFRVIGNEQVLRIDSVL